LRETRDTKSRCEETSLRFEDSKSALDALLLG